MLLDRPPLISHECPSAADYAQADVLSLFVVAPRWVDVPFSGSEKSTNIYAILSQFEAIVISKPSSSYWQAFQIGFSDDYSVFCEIFGPTDEHTGIITESCEIIKILIFDKIWSDN